MENIRVIKKVNNTEILFSTDSEEVKAHLKHSPAVHIISDLNSSFTNLKFAVMASSEEELKKAADDEYCNYVMSRYYKTPLIIADTGRLIIKELSPGDESTLNEILEEDPVLGSFVKAESLIKYIEETYHFYDFGIWGVYLEGELIGVSGFTLRTGEYLENYRDIAPKNNIIHLVLAKKNENIKESLELSYAIMPKYRRKGYAYEACRAVMEYAMENIEYNSIYVRIKPENEPSIKLANKLSVTSNPPSLFTSVVE